MASQSSSSMALWSIYGAVCTAFFPNTLLIEGIVPTSWKKYSGLNSYAKKVGKTNKNGTVDKKAIKQCIIETVKNVPDNLEPVDLYDSIAIGKAGIERNLERLKQGGIIE